MSTRSIERILHSAKRYPHRPALKVGQHEYPYAELISAAQQQAGALIRLSDSITGPVRCALGVGKSLAGYSAVLATRMAKSTWVPLNADYPVERNISILEQSQCQLLVLSPEFVQQAESLVNALVQGNSHLCLLFVEWESIPAWANHLNCDLITELRTGENRPLVEVDRECSIAYLMYTSGSTGHPKGVVVRDDNLNAYVTRILDIYQPDCEDRFSQFFDFTFDLSVHDLFVCWSAGACLVSATNADRLMPAAYARRNKISMWFSVPTIATKLILMNQLAENSLPDIKHMLFCGEPLMSQTALRCAHAAPNASIDNLYGPTEATIAFTLKRLNEKEMKQIGVAGIGQPFDGLDALVLGPENQLCNIGEKGELILAGDQLSQGYWESPDLTDQHFINQKFENSIHHRWYRTGDLASLTSSGDIQFHGRIDSQIKLRGYRVELQEVEQVIMRQPLVSNAAAVVQYDSEGIPDGIIVYAVLHKDCTEVEAKERILEHARKYTPSYMIPDSVYLIDNLPVNTNGKTDRAALSRLANRTADVRLSNQKKNSAI